MSQLGKFEILETLGSGTFGEVYRVRDTLLNVERAIKIVKVKNPEAFIQAINEAQILEKCRHKHIVDIKEISIQNVEGQPCPCIITEYLSNGSVQDYMADNFVSVSKAIQIISEALFGLEHAHSQGIFHRDIKPGNILFSDGNEAKLADFGLAYGLPHQDFNYAGYTAHIPPEVLEGLVQDDISDLYSVGITFYRLVNNMRSLKAPFFDKLELLQNLKSEKFPIRSYKSHIPEAVFKIVNKSMKADRDKRFNSCVKFRQALPSRTSFPTFNLFQFSPWRALNFILIKSLFVRASLSAW